MKLLGSTKTKIAKQENGENELYLEIAEVVLMHCNVVNNSFEIQESCIHLFLINHLVNYHPKKFFLKKLLTQNFHILKCGLQIKILDLQRTKIK